MKNEPTVKLKPALSLEEFLEKFLSKALPGES